jgi:hypothetical protein
MADGVDEWSTGGVAKHIHFSALGGVHECLSDVSIDGNFAALHYLRYLILRCRVHVDFCSVKPRSQVVTGVSEDIQSESFAMWAESCTAEPLSAPIEGDYMLPSRPLGRYNSEGSGVIPFRVEP